MSSLTEIGFARVQIEVSVNGPMDEKTFDKVQNAIINSLKKMEVSVKGEITHVRATKFEGQFLNTLKSDTTS